MAIVDDFSIATNGDIRWGSGSNYTVIAFHRWLGDLMDDALAVGNDLLDITDATASERSTDNIITLKAPFNIDDTTAQHLYDGSVIQDNGNTIYEGILVFAAAGMYLNIVQNGALATNFWTTGLNADAANGISHRFMLKVRTAGADIDGRRLIGQTREFGFTYSEFKINGTARGNNVLALTYATDLNNATASATVDGWDTISNVRTSSTTTVSGVNATGQAVLNVVSGAVFAVGDFINIGALTDEYQINTKSVNALTLSRNLQVATVGGETVFKIGQGYRSIDVDNNTVVENYYSEWNKDTFTINQFYERMKWLTRRGTGELIYGLNGELFRGITHEIVVGPTRTGTFANVEPVSWSGGTGQMLAIDSNATATKMWIQIRTGVAPTNTQVITGGKTGATVTVNVTITERTLSFPFIGSSTGSALIGAYGVGVEVLDLSASDKLTDLTNTLRVPPNNVTFTVSGLVSGEDRVLVGPLGYEFAYDNEVGGAMALGDSLSWPTGNTGTLSSIRDDGLTGRMQIKLSGTSLPPTDNTVITSGAKTVDVNGTVVASEDPRQLVLTAVALSGATVTTVPCTTAIPTDTPSAAGTTGSIRIKLASGLFRDIAYTSYSGNDFTIPSTNFSADNAPASTSIFIGYIDKLATAASASFTGVYSADRSLFVRVRDGAATPIKTFETTGTLGTAGGSSTAIRTSDA